MDENKRKNKKKRAINIGSLLLAICCIIYIPSLFHWAFGNDIATDLIRIGVIEDSITTDAYIFRNEEVLNAPFDGKFIPALEEGDKAGVGSPIAMVLKESSLKSIDELEQKNLALIREKNRRAKIQDFFSEDVEKLDNEIGSIVRDISREADGNTMGNISHLTGKINEIIQKKITIISGGSAKDSYIESLEAEIKAIQEKISEDRFEQTAPHSGIVSFVTDGYEGILTPDSIETLTPKDLDALNIVQETKNSYDRLTEAGKPFAKIVDSLYYYFVFTLNTEDASILKEGNYIGKIRINDLGTEVDGRVYYKSAGQEGKCVVAVRSDKAVSETCALRKVNIDLVFNSYEGLKVPLRSIIALREDDLTGEIMLVESNFTVIKEIKIIGKNSEYAIIDNKEAYAYNGISLYDTYVVDPRNVEEGQVIEK